MRFFSVCLPKMIFLNLKMMSTPKMEYEIQQKNIQCIFTQYAVANSHDRVEYFVTARHAHIWLNADAIFTCVRVPIE